MRNSLSRFWFNVSNTCLFLHPAFWIPWKTPYYLKSHDMVLLFAEWFGTGKITPVCSAPGLDWCWMFGEREGNTHAHTNILNFWSLVFYFLALILVPSNTPKLFYNPRLYLLFLLAPLLSLTPFHLSRMNTVVNLWVIVLPSSLIVSFLAPN